MKELLEQRNCTIYKIQKDLGIGNMKLRRLIKGTTKKVDYKMICDVAQYLKVEPNVLYEEIIKYRYERNRKDEKSKKGTIYK